MSFQITHSPHIHNQNSVTRVMLNVIYALIPGIMLYIWFFGWGIVVNILLASTVALSCEAAVLWLRKRPIIPTLMDGSALVMAILLALTIPPLAPWWIICLGAALGIVMAKHLYGGLGNNNFNPAMVGYVMLLISFPVEMTQWPALASLSGHHVNLWDSIGITFAGQPFGNFTLDSVTGATALDSMKTELGRFHTVDEIKANPLFGDFGAKGWEWMGNAFFIAGCWLIYKKVITWHIPVAMLGSLFLIASIFYMLDPDVHPSPLFHIFSGAAIIGAFFIATDPVSAATSNKGRLIYGAGIGILTYVIRTWGGYPDGVAFAVLLMNMSAPMIDYYTQPRVFGQK